MPKIIPSSGKKTQDNSKSQSLFIKGTMCRIYQALLSETEHIMFKQVVIGA